jgi:hypothetical protein
LALLQSGPLPLALEKGDGMSVRETSAIAIKFLGLWLILNIVIFTPSLAFQAVSIEHFTGEKIDRTALVLFIGTYFILGLMTCYVLFRLSNSVLRPTPDVSGKAESKMSEKFLLQLVGAYFFVSAASELPRFILKFVGVTHSSTTDFSYLPGVLLELAVGLWLLVGPSLWENWLRIVRRQS